MLGTVKKCDLTGSQGYDYRDIMRDLRDKYGFKQIGEGAFGVILAGENCVIKIIKDISRCAELEQERLIYSIIEDKRLQMVDFIAKVPKFHIYNEFTDFCHFNIERIHSPLSGYGDVVMDDDDKVGYGYVIESSDAEYKMIVNGTSVVKPRDSVYSITRPGNLVHFYVNYFDPDLKEKLDKQQGILLGRNKLVEYFTHEKVVEFSYAVGQMMSFLMIDCQIIPVDIEVVIGSKSADDRTVVPYIYDFNESVVANGVQNLSVYDRMARALYSKNGKNYFPNIRNPYYEAFYEGFVTRDTYVEKAKYILNKYNDMF